MSKKKQEIDVILNNLHKGGYKHGSYVVHDLKPSEISLIIEALELLKDRE